MINLKQLSERYKDVGLGHIGFGGHSYYEINSDIPLSLNSYGGKNGFILNRKKQVQIYDLDNREIVKRHYYLTEDWNDEDEVDYKTKYYWDETEPTTWWGKTLDNYYPHPWFTEKEIIAFELVNDIPGHRKGKTFEVIEYQIKTALTVNYSVDDCLFLPEFFKPLYNE
jgi:hypothetical protein